MGYWLLYLLYRDGEKRFHGDYDILPDATRSARLYLGEDLKFTSHGSGLWTADSESDQLWGYQVKPRSQARVTVN
jgi:hypothetical protein